MTNQCSGCGKKLIRKRKTGMCRTCYDKSKTGENNPNWKGGMVLQVCKQCEAEFEVFPSQAKKGNRTFCSIECRAKWQSEHRQGENSTGWRGGKVTLRCEQCSEEFEVNAHRIDTARFCSMSCKGKWQSENLLGENHPYWKGGKVTQFCIICGKEFKVKPYIVRYGEGKFCSNACMGKWRSQNGLGENNPNWQGGISFEPYGLEWTKELKRYIRKRDGHKCALCGERARSVHHTDYCKINNDPANLITLCKSCHSRTNYNRRFWRTILAPVARRREVA